MRNRVKIVYLLIVLFIPLLAFSQVTVNATTPINGGLGDTVRFAINVSDLTNANVFSTEFQMHYDKTEISVVGYDIENAIGASLDNIGLGKRDYGKFLSAYGSTALSGKGVLIYVKVKLLKEGSFNMDIKEFYLNSTEYTVNSVTFATGVSEVALPTSEVDKKSNKLLPITIDDISSENVTAYEFTFTYDPNIIEIQGIEKSGTVSDGWTISYNAANGTCIVGGFSSTSLSAGTTLLNLNIYGKAEGTSALTFDSFQYNEGSPGAKTVNGKITVISVNEPPVITSAPESSVTIYKNYKNSFFFEASDPDEDNESLTWNYEVVSGDTPDSISISQENDGELVIIPSVADVDKNFSVKVSVTDDYDESADTTIAFTVSDANRAPYWTQEMADVSISENEDLSLDFGKYCVDSDDDEITFSSQLEKNNVVVGSGGSINSSTGVYTWTPNFLQAGEYELTVTASDGEASANDVVVISVSNVNQVPVITDAPTMSVILSAGTKYNYVFKASDADIDNTTLTWTYEKLLGNAPDSISFSKDNDGELVIISSVNELGSSFAYKFAVTDDAGATADTSIVFMVSTGNTAPVWSTKMEDQVAKENEELQLDFATYVTDEEGDNITFTKSLYNSDDELVENSGTMTSAGIYTWTPDYTQAGIYELIVSARDTYSSVNDTILIAVSNTNQLPVITDVPADTVKLTAGHAYTYDLGASDPDEENKMLQWTYEVVEGTPADSVSLIISKLYLMPSTSDKGNIFSLKLIVKDDYSESSDTTVVFKVSGASAIDIGGTPTAFALDQNYPNPFNPTTSIKYQLATSSVVKLTIYDITGNEIRTLVNEKQSEGYKSVVWDARDNTGMRVSTGIYVYQIQAGGYSETKKMMFLK